MPKAPVDLTRFESLVEIVATLRGPEGCPWDKAQDLQSLTSYTIEEAHEYVEAVESKDGAAIAEELGDLLLQVVLNAQVGKDNGKFELGDVIASISEKMVRRHPHVFADESAATPEVVRQQWDDIKAKEKAGKPKKDGFDVPASLPALQRAYEIGKKTKKENFDWPNTEGVWAKVEEEISELKEVLNPLDKERCQEEIGDVFFSLAQLARHLGLEPEQCTRQANARFETRYMKMKSFVSNQSFKELPDKQKEDLWRRAKAELCKEK